MQSETWKFIPNTENQYMASTFGRIKSMYIKTRGKNLHYREYILNPKTKKSGYEDVCIIYNNLLRSINVHILIGITFLKNPENKPQLNHLNGIKNDNRVENLEYVTQSENILHSYKELNHIRSTHRRGKSGKENGKSKAVIQFNMDWAYIEEFDSIQLAKINLNLKSNHIAACCLGKRNHFAGYRWMYKSDFEEISHYFNY